MKEIIEAAFEDRANINPQNVSTEVKQAVNEAIRMLDSGEARVAHCVDLGQRGGSLDGAAGRPAQGHGRRSLHRRHWTDRSHI